MIASPATRFSRIPIAWAAACVVVLGLGFFSISWSYVDTYRNLRDLNTWDWQQVIRYAVSGGLEYRPGFWVAAKAAYDIVGLNLWIYQALVLAQFGAVLALLLWLFRPIETPRAVAAIVALSCVVGLHTTRILFLFVPLNAYSTSLVLLLAALALALNPRTRAYEWVFFPLTAAALFTLESGLLIAPLLVVLWWCGAPGVGLRGVSGAVAAVIVYLTIRFTFNAQVALGLSYTGTGLGLSDATPEQLQNIFEHAPWLFWAYNVSASFLSVVLSEPRAGAYRFIAALLGGGASLWQWLHVLSSFVTTVVVIVAFARYRPTSERDRLLVAAGLVLLVLGSGIGFLYTRDRIGLWAGAGYAMLVFVALAMLLERMPRSGWKRLATIGAVCALAIAWTTRTAETYIQFRDAAWDYRLEWTDRFEDLGGNLQPPGELMTAVRSAALGKSPADPHNDPAWTFALFERRFDPHDGGRRPADESADNAVVPLSTPFDIRWKPDVDDTMRRQFEAELGLADAQQVARDPRGRTWEYRLRTPTRERVRTVLLHGAVEDTGRIDVQRFEIVR
jgi:hypothetical protein